MFSDAAPAARLALWRRSPSKGSQRPRRRMGTVRLGGRRRWWMRGGRVLLGFLRRIRPRKVGIRCRQLLSRLPEIRSRFVRDIIEGSAMPEAVQARMVMESYSGVPICMPLSVM